jgi:DNA uptake protein ComE-like DNA-binding protein
MRAGTVRRLVGMAALGAVMGMGQPRVWGVARSSHAVVRAEDRVDINHASVDELMKVPGMTRTWSARIVRFRPYHSKTDLLQRGVLPGDVYDRIKDYVVAHRAKR